MSQVHHLIYTSRPATSLTDEDMVRILRVARQRNQADHITGYLAFNGESFLQVLEGDAALLTKTITRILGDARHQDSVLLAFAPISARSFADWGMGYAALATQHRSLLLRYSTGGQLAPGSLTAAGAYGFLLDLSRLDPGFLASPVIAPAWESALPRMA